ncbi:DUF2225 domain-containing protein [Priestia megaterium]|nr:DUF2225 domain-containing protein [Priestia megaterium]
MAELHPLYDKKTTCTICQHTFYTKQIRSRFLRIKKYDTDFFIHYENEQLNPLFYHVHICPKCGYASTEQFSTVFPPKTIELIRQKVCAHWVYQPYEKERSINQAVNTYKLALYCATLKREKPTLMGNLTLRLGWLYRILQNKQQEEHFLLHSLKFYTNAYVQESFSRTATELRLLYLIGELNYRLGFSQEAVKYFSEIIYKHKQHPDKKTFELTKDRWSEIRQEQKHLL